MRAAICTLALAALFVLGGCGTGAPACSLVGMWMASPVMGMQTGEKVTQSFGADGSYEVSIDSATWTGSYTQDGAQLTISNDGSCPSGSGDGVYSLKWDTDCKGAIYSLVSDGCVGRAQTFNGMRIIKPF